ncbi:MAG TPA: phasin family protein [Candidatus Anoxymicrobiaceae bacterium]|jgi:polyhydroxyalkanoate synthesis regulator phasin
MEMNDMPYLLLGALASVRDDSINTVDDMVKKGKELAEGGKAKVKETAQDKKLEATIQDLVKKGKKESEELVDSIGKVVKDTLDSLGIVTKSDIKSVEDRLAGLEKKLGTTKKPAKKAAKKKAAKKPAKKKAAKKPAKKKAAKKA